MSPRKKGRIVWRFALICLYIHEHPTRERGLYQVLKLDFSQAGGSLESLYENFGIYCSVQLNEFIKKYAKYYDEDLVQRVLASDNYNFKLDYIGQAYHDATAVRSLIEGERNLQGFMNAYLTLTPYWLTQPETELSHGYCDFFLMPDLARYPMVEHSYILELKYLRPDATEQEAQTQWQEAVEQIRRYAQDRRVGHYIGHTQLHLIIAQVRGYTWERVEEVC